MDRSPPQSSLCKKQKGHGGIVLSRDGSFGASTYKDQICAWPTNNELGLVPKRCLKLPKVVPRDVSEDGTVLVTDQTGAGAIAWHLHEHRSLVNRQPIKGDWEHSVISANGQLPARGINASNYESAQIEVWSLVTGDLLKLRAG